MSNENGSSVHHETLLGDRPGSYAVVHYIRTGPMKVRRVVSLTRGMGVSEVLTALRFTSQAASEPVYKVVASTVAGVENIGDPDSQDLYVSKAFVNEGMTLRRIRPCAKGSASRILKRGSHIAMVVEP